MKLRIELIRFEKDGAGLTWTEGDPAIDEYIAQIGRPAVVRKTLTVAVPRCDPIRRALVTQRAINRAVRAAGF